MAPRELSHWQLLPAWKRDIIAHGYRLVWPGQATASILKMSAEQITRVGQAALLHDLGKLALPRAILLKPGPLSAEEWAIIHRHPELGAQMLSRAGAGWAELGRIVVAHHERWDGGGYPRGLAREAIPLEARIPSVVDAFDAMTSPRVYRQPRAREEARAELERCSDLQFDPLVVAAFLQVLDGREQMLARVGAGAPAPEPVPRMGWKPGRWPQLVAALLLQHERSVPRVRAGTIGGSMIRNMLRRLANNSS